MATTPKTKTATMTVNEYVPQLADAVKQLLTFEDEITEITFRAGEVIQASGEVFDAGKEGAIIVDTCNTIKECLERQIQLLMVAQVEGYLE